MQRLLAGFTPTRGDAEKSNNEPSGVDKKQVKGQREKAPAAGVKCRKNGVVEFRLSLISLRENRIPEVS